MLPQAMFARNERNVTGWRLPVMLRPYARSIQNVRGTFTVYNAEACEYDGRRFGMPMTRQ